MQNLSVTQCILSLASNFHAEQNLALARTILGKPLDNYKDITVQSVNYNPVILSQDKNILLSINPCICTTYHNQIAWLSFSSPITLERLHNFTKSVEQLALRHKFAKPIVSLDIDILAICASKKSDSLTGNAELIPLLSYPYLLFNSYKPTHVLPCKWYGITRRFPLANYDRYGINYLLSHQLSNTVPILPIL